MTYATDQILHTISQAVLLEVTTFST